MDFDDISSFDEDNPLKPHSHCRLGLRFRPQQPTLPTHLEEQPGHILHLPDVHQQAPHY
jgi:hypothetical protein